MLKEKIIYFVVEGRGAFPTDMLRYDSCEPATDEDMQAINRGEYVGGPKRQIALERDIAGLASSSLLARISSTPGVTPNRWASFGWKVVQYEKKPVVLVDVLTD